MAKRGHREGSIYQLPSGSWRAQIYSNGYRLSHTEKTRSAVIDWLHKTQGELGAGLRLNISQQLYKDFLSSWIANIKPSLRGTAAYQYQMTAKRYIYPALGNIKLINLRPEHIQNLYNMELEKGTGLRTIEIIHTVIRRSLGHALKLGAISRNPALATSPPRYKPKEMKFFTEPEVAHFLASSKGTRYEALYHLAIATGMRQSELLGLLWSDLDWDKRSLRIQRQLKRNGNPGDLFESPKTKAGNRTIILGRNTIRSLREHMLRQASARQMAGDRWREHDLIFPSSIGTPLNHRNVYTDFKEFLKHAGLREIRFHDLRHTAATLMLNHGVPAIIVSKRLGHARVSITLDIYGHMIPEMQHEVADLIDELITPVAIDIAHDCTRQESPKQ